MFARLLLWLVIGVAAWWLLKPRRKITPPAGAARASAATGAADAAAVAPETMVGCASCGLLFPGSEATHDDAARAYCCAAHRDAGPRRA